MILCVCLFVTAQGAFDLFRGIPEGGPPISKITGSVDTRLWTAVHPYLYVTKSDGGAWIYRLRGLGFINDPNDFGQMLVCVMPLLFIFWRPKKLIHNIAFVILPSIVLLMGIYLTRSRGALLALVAVALVAGRRKFGTVPALIVAAGLFAGAMALHFTGGRQISIQAGEDRTTLWSEGLTMVKTNPLFGVGIHQFAYIAGHTAHNSIVVCAAELGVVGFYFWTLFLFPTVREALVIASPERVTGAGTVAPEDPPFPFRLTAIEVLGKEELNRLGHLLVLSLTGFLVSGWFLSRAFVMTFFLLGGMTEAVYEMALQRGMVLPRLPMARVLLYALVVMIGLLGLVYVMLRILNLLR